MESSGKIIEIDHVHRRFGYRRINDLLRRECQSVNQKHIYHLHVEASQTVRRGRKAKVKLSERVPFQLAKSIDEMWSKDFVSDCLAIGQRIKCLSVVDDFRHESIETVVDYEISG